MVRDHGKAALARSRLRRTICSCFMGSRRRKTLTEGNLHALQNNSADLRLTLIWTLRRRQRPNCSDLPTFATLRYLVLNHEDVLDLSYRTAWKLDPVYFASKLDIYDTASCKATG